MIQNQNLSVSIDLVILELTIMRERERERQRQREDLKTALEKRKRWKNITTFKDKNLYMYM